MDILQNSIRAEAKCITLSLELKDKKLLLEFIDDGKGIDKEMLAKVEDPFFTTRTTRKIGLGISLLKQNCEKTDGYFLLTSQVGKGTKLKAIFNYTSIDMLPIGDLVGVFMLCVIANENIQFILKTKSEENNFLFDTEEIKKELEITQFNSVELNNYIKDYIKGNIDEFLVLL